MADLPIMLKLAGRRCLIVGGGAVALRRARAFMACDAQVVVVAPQIDPDLEALGVELHARKYKPADLKDVVLVVTATNDARLNAQVAIQATRHSILVNRADDATAGDFVVPAHRHEGPLTIAVHASGVSASASARIRDQLIESLDPDWIRLLELIAPYRKLIQQSTPDAQERQERLRQLASQQMLDLYKSSGADAVTDACENLYIHIDEVTPDAGHVSDPDQLK